MLDSYMSLPCLILIAYLIIYLIIYLLTFFNIESRSFKPQPSQNQLEYLVESWRPEETCCHSDFSKKKITSSKLIEKTCKIRNCNFN